MSTDSTSLLAFEGFSVLFLLNEGWDKESSLDTEFIMFIFPMLESGI